MTVRANLTQTCDRCMRPFNEQHLKAGDAIPEVVQSGLKVFGTRRTNTSTDVQETMLFAFEDICPTCSSALESLLARVKLDGKSPKEEEASVAVAVPGHVLPVKARRRRRTKAEMMAARAAETGAQAGAQEAEIEESPEVPAYSEAQVEPIEPVAQEKTSTEASSAGPSNGNGNGNGSKAGVTYRELIEDPETGNLYDPATGEVVVPAQAAGKVLGSDPSQGLF